MRSSEEMCAHNHRQRMKVEECEKIDRAELAIDCRRAADPCADGQIRAQNELRRRQFLMPTQDRRLL